jgi:hypothetical protein
MWFVCFCYLSYSWRKTKENSRVLFERHKIQASVVFSFFSIFVWIALSLLAIMRYRQGPATLSNNDYEDHSHIGGDSGNKFNSYQNIHASSYKQAPFSNDSFDYSNPGYQQSPNY